MWKDSVRKYKKEPTRLKNTITKTKNTLEGDKSKLLNEEEWISDLEDKAIRKYLD